MLLASTGQALSGSAVKGANMKCLVCCGAGFVDPTTKLCPSHADQRVHVLKTWPESFQAIWTGKKTFEIRKNDRDFRDRDILLLREWSKESGYSGHTMRVRVIYLAIGTWGLPKDLAVMSIVKFDSSSNEIFPEGDTR